MGLSSAQSHVYFFWCEKRELNNTEIRRAKWLSARNGMENLRRLNPIALMALRKKTVYTVNAAIIAATTVEMTAMLVGEKMTATTVAKMLIHNAHSIADVDDRGLWRMNDSVNRRRNFASRIDLR